MAGELTTWIKERIYASLDRMSEFKPARAIMIQAYEATGTALGAGNHDNDGQRTGENKVVGAIGVLNPQAVFLDIGANNGSWTLEIRARIPKSTVIAVEPGTAALATLRSRLQGDPHVYVLPHAIGNTNTSAPLFGIDNALQASLRPEVLSRTTRVGQSNIPFETIEVRDWETTQKDLAALGLDLDHTKLTAIKIDIEGLELDVLRQLAAWPGFASVEVVQFEFHMHALAQGQIIADFHEVLGQSFELFRLSKHALIPRTELNDATANYFGFSNWVAIRCDQTPEFTAAFRKASGARARPYEWRC